MKRTARFGSLRVGEGSPVRVLAAINLSPESFYKGSVATTSRQVALRVKEAVEHGADAVDIGAMSTAPYLANEVPAGVELDRIAAALRAISGTGVPISVDTVRASVADFALRNGASVVNDVSGLKHDARMAKVVKDRGASLLAMAHGSGSSGKEPIAVVGEALGETLRVAARAGIDERRIVLDPGIGFFREEGAGTAYSPQKLMPWHEWDSSVIANLSGLKSLGRPLCIGLSRKSFLGKILGLPDPADRLSASIAATALAVANGAHMIRTHDVRETVQAVRVAQAILRRGRREAQVS